MRNFVFPNSDIGSRDNSVVTLCAVRCALSALTPARHQSVANLAVVPPRGGDY
jgi:hypothetical protein